MSAQTTSETPRTDAARKVCEANWKDGGFQGYSDDEWLSMLASTERELAAAKARVVELERECADTTMLDSYADENQRISDDRDQLRATVARQAEEIERLGQELIQAKALKVCCGDFKNCAEPCVPLAQDLRAQVERLRKDAQNRYYEHRRQLARADALMEQLLRIHALVHPPNMSAGGREFRFNPPEHLVREAWEGLSKAIRDIPAAIDTALAKEPTDE